MKLIFFLVLPLVTKNHTTISSMNASKPPISSFIDAFRTPPTMMVCWQQDPAGRWFGQPNSKQETVMNKLIPLSFALLATMGLAACNSETVEAERAEARAAANDASKQMSEAADAASDAVAAAGDAAAATAEAAAAGTAAAAGAAAVAVDAAADPVQAAYEEGKANAAGAIAEGAKNVAENMKQEQVEAEAAANQELQD